MKYDNLMILASLELIIICFLVYIGFKLKAALELRDTVIIELIETSIKAIEMREDAQRLREESQAHLEEARIHLEKAESLLKKVTKLSEDSISTLDEAKKYTTSR